MKIVIMAGGKGTRFWPRSVDTLPKQFLALTGKETMLQQTYRRFQGWLPQENIFVVTIGQYIPVIREQLPELGEDQLILEPEQRDTAACIALTALLFLQREDDEVLVTLPSDQHIPDWDALRTALLLAEETARSDRAIVTLGIVPTRPETGYGYMERSETPQRPGVYPVKSFIEKPSFDRAQQLVKSKHVYWNSGIFIWKPSTIAHYMNAFRQDLWECIQKAVHTKDFDAEYARLPRISVDYAVIEKADTLYTIPVTFDWDDVGYWTSLERIHGVDQNGNMLSGNIRTLDTSNSIVYSNSDKAIVIGLEDVIVVSTEHGLLVCHKSQEQRVKDVLNTFDKPEGEC